MPQRYWITLFLRTGGVVCLWLALAGWPGATPAGAPVAAAATITVTSTADPSGGGCTLRDAITAANTNGPTGGCPAGSPGLDTIDFSLPGACRFQPCNIQFGSSLPTITEDLVITGGGVVLLSGDGAVRLFDVAGGVTLRLQHLILENAYSNGSDGGAIANHGNLWLESSTIQNSATDPGHSGGAIFSDGPVTITNSLLQNNQGGSAGALFANFGKAVVTIGNSTFSQNQAITTSTGYGGAIWVGSLAQVTIIGGAILSNTANDGGGLELSPGAAVTITANGLPASINGNTAVDSGGGIESDQGALNLTNATLSGNSAFLGGGIYNNQGTVTLAQATISSNTAYSQTGFGGPVGGGGLFNDGSATLTNDTLSGNSGAQGGAILIVQGGAVTLANTTLSGNSATFFGGGLDNGDTLTATNVTFAGNTSLSLGGGILNDGSATLVNVTLSGNVAPTGGALNQSGGSLTLQNTLVADSLLGANCHVDSMSAKSLTSGGHNLSSDGSCMPDFSQPTDLNSLDPMLGPLGNNGGPTLTFLPNPLSPAIDAIPLGVNGCGTTLTTDQRGVDRPFHGQCDIGAVEAVFAFPRLWLPLLRG